MLPQDRWPEMVDGTYSRAGVQRFLDEADAARERAEALLDAANQRRRALHQQLAEIVDRNAAVNRDLVHTAREVSNDRQSHASAVAVILASAEAEAAAILAKARDEAAAIRASTEPPLLVS